MKYANKEAQDAFSGRENYDKPLTLLEQSFKAAGLNIEFECETGKHGKMVSIYRGGFLQKLVSIHGDNPAAAVKDVAGMVKL